MFRKLFGALAAGIGTDLGAWTSSKTGLWSAKNGVIHGNGTARGWLYYNKQQVGTFRWIFNVRGTAEPIRDALSAIQFQPPNGGHWDYRPGHDNGGGKLFQQLPHTTIDVKKWAQCELIGDTSSHPW